jgi:hypothetical protein
MGRTIPSFRMASAEEQKEWKEFRQALDKKDRKVFDNMFSICRLYNSACSFAAKPIRIHPIFMSTIFIFILGNRLFFFYSTVDSENVILMHLTYSYR